MEHMMNAVVLTKKTSVKDVCVSQVEIPKVVSGWVLIKVKVFGMNHSEQMLREFEIESDYINKPVIPGIECVGVVEDPSDTDLQKGQKVIAMMGGMGRSFDGSYAEYALLPRHHVFTVDSDLSWEKLAAIPETYFTAWGSLFECLRLKKDDILLIRGASCALGYAALQIAKAVGCKVVVTTHREKYFSSLKDADEILMDKGILTGNVKGITKALDLIGPRNILDTLTAVEKGATVCQTGILGGVYVLDGFDPIKDIPNGVYLTGFYSNFPTQEIVDDMFAFISENKLEPIYGPVYRFRDIKEAMCMQESGKAGGKIVVVVEE
ncbi:alcohol dehydrogenase catalytic domain-containing protein [Pseudobutyrivibrio sp.]|uniref:alcohol dehydrogenase catalytic domain-containing protein n=1 Tax=Pseudobutyrivibrio sp. TaxID=2014367 RepID=UPI0025F0F1FE|nr:zinc-binding dehydrogenase [Pseudobutyrivibrio sp.]